MDDLKVNARSHNEAKRDSTFICVRFPVVEVHLREASISRASCFPLMYKSPTHLSLGHIRSHNEENPVCLSMAWVRLKPSHGNMIARGMSSYILIIAGPSRVSHVERCLLEWMPSTDI